MSIDSQEVKTKILSLIEEADVQVQGEDGQHFHVEVTSTRFEGLSQLKRQQWVYKAVQADIQSGRLHAMALKTWTPQERKK